jgi:hypothetical protein
MIMFNKKLDKAGAAMRVLAILQEILYLDTEPTKDGPNTDDGFVLNPDKEQDSDTLSRINNLAAQFGLRPKTKVPFQ